MARQMYGKGFTVCQLYNSTEIINSIYGAAKCMRKVLQFVEWDPSKT